jgi:hypothetical protein
MNCQSCYNEIENLLFGEQLSAGGKLHLEICATCRKFSAEREQMRVWMQELEKVSAPADFNIQVRKRLNQAQTSKPAFYWLSWKTAVPATALAAILGFGWWNFSSFQTNQTPINTNGTIVSNPTVATTESPLTLPSPIASPESVSSPKNIETVAKTNNQKDLSPKVAPITQPKSETVLIANQSKPRFSDAQKVVHPNRTKKNKDIITSRDSVVTKVNKSITPPGIPDPTTDADKLRPKNPNLEGITFPTRTNQAILSDIGLEVEESTDQKSWQVKSIKKDSRASRSEIAEGDVIEQVEEKQQVNSPNEVTVKVRRKNETKQIKVPEK